MILTVALNPALDVTYHVAQVRPGESHRVRTVRRRAGGKAVNVARVLCALGLEARVTGLVGGRTGQLLCEELVLARVRHLFLPVAGETRHTLTVVDEATGEATVFNEAGPHVSPAEWRAFVDGLPALLERASVLVLSGSLPPGIPDDAYATLAAAAQAAGATVIVDAEGEPLLAAAEATGVVLKVNRDELLRTTGSADPLLGAARLRDKGAAAVIVTLGAQGAIAVTNDGVWSGRPPESVAGNPTGAGDAFAAALAGALSDGASWPAALRQSIAASAAAVAVPYAGEIDLEARPRFQDSTIVEELS